MLNWLKKSDTEIASSNASLRVIGDRASGKTTYMASLAYWPNANPDSPVQSVISVNDETSELVTKAQNILEQGLMLEPTDLDASPDEVKDYTLSITLKDRFSRSPLGKKGQMSQLTVNCKDYAGEFLSDLIHKSGDPILESYLEDCLQVEGILLLIDGTAHRKDSQYAIGLDKFLMALDRTDLDVRQRRIALVVTKCEQSELWINRHKPRELATARFPHIYRKLESWQQTGSGKVDYFNASAFGMLGSQFPEPNAKKLQRDRNGTTAVLKNPKRWRPFGLVAPIYWLCTGERHQDLEKD